MAKGIEKPLCILLAGLAFLPLLPLLYLYASVFWADGPSLKHLLFFLTDLPRLAVLMRNSLVCSAVTLLTAGLLGTLGGFILQRCRFKGRTVFLTLFIVMAAVPFYSLVTMMSAPSRASPTAH